MAPAAVTVTGGAGAVAECGVPSPPLAADPADPYGGLVAHALADRRVGVLLVRLGGPLADPSWQAEDVSLEDLVLRYMGATETRARARLAAIDPEAAGGAR